MSAPTTILNGTHLASSSPPLYVPVHKRAGSNTSSPSSPSSPSSTLPPGKPFFPFDIPQCSLIIIDTPSYVYSPATLLSLQPFADESMKGKMRALCPEVVITRKMRRGLEFNGSRMEIMAAQKLLQVHPVAPLNIIHHHTKATPPLQVSTPTRVPTRRSRPAGRAPERRRNAITSFGARRTENDSWRPQTVPLPPVLFT